MPFKSKAQIAKFAILEKEGKLPKGTLHQWASETANIRKLPAHVKQSNPHHQRKGS